MDEADRRTGMWRELQSSYDVDAVAPTVLRELGVYGGAQGIWVDSARTAKVSADGKGITVGLLHTGRSYPDDLSGNEILYHYPSTRRAGRDASEIAATKNAASMQLPVFVVTPAPRDLRRVYRGEVRGWDDGLGLFRITLDRSVTPPVPTRRGRARATANGALGPYRPVDVAATAAPRDPFSIDPNKVDRGLQGHARTQEALAAWLERRGLTPKSPTGVANFDVAWRHGDQLFVAEVKSLTNANETQQLRLGLGQVLDYQELLKASEGEVVAILVAERRPSNSRWLALCARLGVRLTWPPDFPSLD